MTPKDLTHEMLIGWGGAEVFNQALMLAKRGLVVSAEWDDANHQGTGKISRPDGWDMPTGFTLMPNGLVTSQCPCQMNRVSGMICPHVVAIGLYLMCRMSDPEAEEAHQRELRTARRVEQIDPSLYIRRSTKGVPMRLQLKWNEQTLVEDFHGDGVKASLVFYDRAGNGYLPEDPLLRAEPGVALSENALNLLSVLEDVCEGPVTNTFTLKAPDFLNVAQLLSQGRKAHASLHADFDEEHGTFELFPFADVPFEHIASDDRFFVHGRFGVVWSAPLTEKGAGPRRFLMLDHVLKEPFQSLYRHDEIIPRESMPSFLHANLPLLRAQGEVQLSPSEDLFKFVPDHPVIRVKISGSRASLGADLYAVYGKREIVCGEATGVDEICRPDPDDLLLYHMRNTVAEEEAIKTLLAMGFERQGNSPRLFITEPREVLNFLGSGGPALTRRGWKVVFSEKLDDLVDGFGHILAKVDVTDAQGGEFEVGCAFDDGGRHIPQSEIQAALNRGESYLMRNGETLLLDGDAIRQMREMFADTPSSPGARAGHFRVKPLYAPYVAASLNVFADDIVLEDDQAPNWRETAAQRNRDEHAKYEAVDLGRLEGTLRPYQKEGVYWMRFLEKSGLSGLLADEMGLGKTLQTLTWLSLSRTDPAAQGKPALVVCPTSLVQNWAAEAEKFTPWMKRLIVSGPDRAEHFAHIGEYDLVITSYALLQRDLEAAYRERQFSVIVLDEAQHIKNRQTRNAKAAKQIDAVQKLVLTGTPVENSVADVWSIFDFLMPDYLGRYDLFKSTTQDPIEAGGPEGLAEQQRLHRKLHPFILRRLKKTVARDLPDKIIKVAYAPMTPEQQREYNRLLADAKSRIGNMVQEKGFAKSRMEILALLMRLRQVASHLALLKEYRDEHGISLDTPNSAKGSDELSGKLAVFFEMLEEAIDGGHRVLVFSQFVTMLTILRREFEARGIRYCYLDGATKDRLGECRKFNTDESIPVFLISLHAGGTGLNLTGADMVVHFDPWWNPAVEDQATDRAHRIGQKRTVYVVKMIAEHSVEERVLALQQKKQLVIDATVGTTDEAAVQKLTYDDIKAIVGL